MPSKAKLWHQCRISFEHLMRCCQTGRVFKLNHTHRYQHIQSSSWCHFRKSPMPACVVLHFDRFHSQNLETINPLKKETEKSILPETNSFAPENGWLEYEDVSFFLGRLGLFSGANR